MRFSFCTFVLLLFVHTARAASAARIPCRVVGEEELLEIMQTIGGYDGTATTNSFRFQVDTLLGLVRVSRAKDPLRRPLLINYETWRRAFCRRYQLTQEELPLYARLAYKHRQDTCIDYRRENVIARVKRGPEPKLAMNVKVWWPSTKDALESYVYTDTTSDPVVRIRNMRLITYRLIVFEDMTLADDIRGLRGEPTTGLLGLLFRVIGEGRAVYGRMAVSADGLMVLRGQARRGPIKVTSTVTIHPDGQTTAGVPKDREDLKDIEARLKKRPKIRYVPLPSEPEPDSD